MKTVNRRTIHGRIFEEDNYYSLQLRSKEEIEQVMKGDVNDYMLELEHEWVSVRFIIGAYRDKFQHHTGYFFPECFILKERNIDHEQKLTYSRSPSDLTLPDFLV